MPQADRHSCAENGHHHCDEDTELGRLVMDIRVSPSGSPRKPGVFQSMRANCLSMGTRRINLVAGLCGTISCNGWNFIAM